MAYRMKEGSRNLFLEFSGKYGVDLDVSKLLGTLETISTITRGMKDNVERAGGDTVSERVYNMEQVKLSEIEKIKTSYHNTYKSLLSDALEEFVDNTRHALFDSKVNTGTLTEDFEKMMNEIMYQENKAANYVAFSKLAYGGMEKEELSDLLLHGQDYPQLSDVMLDSFGQKSVSTIAQQVRADYVNGSDRSYKEYISMVQALKEKNDSRGFFGKLFHPIDTVRERSLIRELTETAKNRFSDRKVEQDIAEKHFISEKGDMELMASYESVKNLKKIEFAPEQYNKAKIAELHEKYAKPENSPEARRAAAEKKYREEIYPRIEKVYLATVERNGEAQGVEMDLSQIAKQLKIEPADMKGYETRFLSEMEEKQRVTAESDRYKEVYPKFRDAFEKNDGDLSSLRDEIGQDYDLMKTVFLHDMREQKEENVDFEKLLKAETSDTLKIDAEIESFRVSEQMKTKEQGGPGLGI
ncbi:MAG: hypothetical protein MJ082_02755 [Clostridia bacterium]|nr:hypothetical protein [Clostridia bacterium]